MSTTPDSTALYASPISGLIHSRRLGLSLGINILPPDGKVCSFDCLYCECGFNADRRPRQPMPTRQQVTQALEQQLTELCRQGVMPDALTFSGNGEPTLHPCFPAIVDDVLELRDRLTPRSRVCVLTNATRVHHLETRQALMRVDDAICKLDTVTASFIAATDRPAPGYDVNTVVKALASMNGHPVVQTIFLHQGTTGNTTDADVEPWLEALQLIRPRQVMIYTIDRPTPCPTLSKATPAELDAISLRVKGLGIDCIVAY